MPPVDESIYPFEDPFNGFPPEQRESNDITNAVYGDFAEARWTRVGASEGELAFLKEAHDARTLDEQGAEGKRVAGLHDDNLKAELNVFRAAGGDPASSPYNGTVAEVKDHVGDDAAMAAEALAFEASPFGKGRTSLVGHLEKIGSAEYASDETHPSSTFSPIGIQADPGAEGTGPNIDLSKTE